MVMLEDCHGLMLLRNEDGESCSEGSEARVKSVGKGRNIAVIQYAGDESAGGMEVQDWIRTRPALTAVALGRVCMQS